MITREEYEKTFIRMMDGLRKPDFKGNPGCGGVSCDKFCPLYNVCWSVTSHSVGFNAFKIVEIVEQWGKEHPIITNADKFKEVFGHFPMDHTNTNEYICPERLGFKCEYHTKSCTDCKKEFWGAEYIEPNKENE